MAELWDLYDKDRNPLHRTHQRGLPLAPGEYHLAVIVVIVNHRGEVLLTRRAKEKDLCPGWWENTGGSVLAGETSLEAILRELREETGIHAQPEELTLLLQENCRTDAHFDIYALTWEGEASAIRFQPEGPSSWASAWVKPMSAAFEAEYAASQEAPCCPHMELMFTMDPRFSRIMAGRKARQHKKAPVQFTSSTRRHSASVMSVSSPFQAMPALFTSTSTKPRSRWAAAAMASTWPSSATSAW